MGGGKDPVREFAESVCVACAGVGERRESGEREAGGGGSGGGAGGAGGAGGRGGRRYHRRLQLVGSLGSYQGRAAWASEEGVDGPQYSVRACMLGRSCA